LVLIENLPLDFKDLEGLAALKAYTRQLIYFCAEHPEYYKLVFHEMCTKTERATWFIENITLPSDKWYLEENKKVTDKQLKFILTPNYYFFIFIFYSLNQRNPSYLDGKMLF